MMKKLIAFVSIALLIIAGLLGFQNRQFIKDWYVVNTKQQQSEAIAVASSLELTDEGNFLYEASQPKILPADEFNEACKAVDKELTIVLGCYTAQRFYVFQVDDSRLQGVEEVTAAHELLHSVYERLPQNDKDVLNREIQLASNAITDPHFVELVDQYKKSEPAELDNEIHSIIGTEIAVLPKVLEDHYGKYFKNRSKIVEFSKSYQSVFKENSDKIESYDAKLKELKLEIEDIESGLLDLEKELSLKQAELARLRSQDTSLYNVQVPVFNAMVSEYNSRVGQAKDLTTQYNQVVERRNEIAILQTDLSQQLDSNFQTR